MKITAIIFLAACLHVSAAGHAQTVTLSEKNAPLEKVFKDIRQQTGFSFFYDVDLLQRAAPVTLDLRDATLDEALAQCFLNQPFTWTLSGKVIVVSLKDPAQQPKAVPPTDIHGRVIDSAGAPLAGASVRVKGSRRGTSTDANGNFELKGVDNNVTLLISFTGYDSRELKLAGRNEVTISLRQGVSSLDETVVKGYYTTTNRLNTGDVTVVKGETIQQQPVSDPILALEGRVPGLFIQQTSGVPGAYGTIRIMGQNSIANGSDPLYIIDGVPYSSTTLTSTIIGGGALGTPFGMPNSIPGVAGLGASPFNSLNPNEIESIEVLKDADATSIYGSRGANGVILITTKKGKAGRTQFELNIYSGAGKVTRSLQMLNTPEYLAMRHEALSNDGLTPSPKDYDINGTWDSTRFTNWQKVLIGNSAQFTNAQGHLSGGDANTQFLIGGGYSKQSTVYPGSYFDQKASVNVSITHASLDQRLHMQLTANYVNDNSNLPTFDFTNYIALAPDAPAIYTANGNLNWQPLNGTATWSNPLSYTVEKANATTSNLISNLNASYKILPGLVFKSSFGYSNTEMNQSIQIPSSAYAPPNNTVTYYRQNNLAATDFKGWIIEPQFSYEKQISKGRFSALVGSTFQQNSQNSTGYFTSGYASDALLSNPRAASSFSLKGYTNTLYRYNAFFGRINYEWQEKYLLNVTARRDGSSRFGPGRQFGNFVAVGIGWVFSKENFIQNAFPFLSFGKLRASYGSTGNDQIPDYQFLSTYTPSSTAYANVAGLTPSRINNPYFGWELVKKAEGGIDLGFLGNRIVVSAIFYQNRTGDQLVGYPLPSLAGFTSVQANLSAVVQNSGGEFTLNTINVKSKNFTWTSSINLTIPRNKLVSYPNLAGSGYANTYVVDKSLFITKVYHVVGVNDTTGVYQFASKTGPTYNPTYPGDLTASKPITQQWYGGFENSISYKGFRLDFLFQFVKQIGYNLWAAYPYVVAGTFNTNAPTPVLNRWRKPGDVTKYGLVSTQYTADPNNYLQSSVMS